MHHHIQNCFGGSARAGSGTAAIPRQACGLLRCVCCTGRSRARGRKALKDTFLLPFRRAIPPCVTSPRTLGGAVNLRNQSAWKRCDRA